MFGICNYVIVYGEIIAVNYGGENDFHLLYSTTMLVITILYVCYCAERRISGICNYFYLCLRRGIIAVK